MSEDIRWGILATGSIAHKFAEGLKSASGARLTSVGSRHQDKAEEFANKFGAEKAHGSYEQLAGDDNVDIVYVATPHPFHKENTRLCLEAGKAVLCEKPLAMNSAEVQEMIGLAREKKIFLMEAMWTRFLPVMDKVREWLKDGAIGEPRMLKADFGFRAPWEPSSRLLDPKLGGGALLDVGVYTIALSSMVFGGPPEDLASQAHIGTTGVDEQSAMVFKYAHGQLASLQCAVRTHSPHVAYILGTEGSIQIPEFWHATEATLSLDGKKHRVRRPFEGNGYEYEAMEAGRCLREGRLGSHLMPLSESLSIMETMDRVRQAWGLKYPME